MKALSLTQPWASLVAIGAKKIETRSWFTSYRGQLAIHAAKGFPREAQESCWEWPFQEVLQAAGIELQVKLRFGAPPAGGFPVGAVLAVCELADCIPTQRIANASSGFIRCSVPESGEHEMSFGDFSPGRYGWILRRVRRLNQPIPAKGSLGIWEWTPPENLEALCA